MNNDIEFQVSSNRNIAHTCCGCSETIPAGDFFIRTPESIGGDPECVRCFETRVNKRWRETYNPDDYVHGIPDQCSVCERYKVDVEYRELSRSYEWTKHGENGACFCDECFQKILFECRKCYRIYPHDPESRPGKRNADGVWVRDDRHICWDCYEREDTAKKLGVKQHTLILNEQWGNWVSPEREPELALHLGIEDAKEALYKAGMSQEVIDAKFTAEHAAYEKFLAINRVEGEAR
jgi:hypothetical protein